MDLLPNEAACKTVINADLIAAGIAPLDANSAAVTAGKVMLELIDESVRFGRPFAFETTLSGRGYLRRIRFWKKAGYRVVLYYFSLPTASIARERVKQRVAQGGHDIPAIVGLSGVLETLVNIRKPLIHGLSLILRAERLRAWRSHDEQC